jgi:acyl-CoA thioesterase 11
MTELFLPSHDWSTILKWLDLCALVVSRRHSGIDCVTVSMDDVHFQSELAVGDLVILTGVITRAFKSSMEILVEVKGQTLKAMDKFFPVCRVFFTFVVPKQPDGSRPSLTPVVPSTEIERELYEEAEERRVYRLQQAQAEKALALAEGSKTEIAIEEPEAEDSSVKAQLIGGYVCDVTEIVLPIHANTINIAFGGILMGWMSMAALIVGMRWASAPVQIRSIDHILFHAAVMIGEIAVIKAKVCRVWGSVIEVGITVHAQSIKGTQNFSNTGHFILEADKGAQVPLAQPSTKDECIEFNRANLRRRQRQMRKAISDQIHAVGKNICLTQYTPEGVATVQRQLLDLATDTVSRQWSLKLAQSNIRIEHCQSPDGSTSTRVLMAVPCAPLAAAMYLWEPTNRQAYDVFCMEYTVFEKVSSAVDFCHYVARTPVGLPRDFVLLRSFAEGPRPGVYVLASQSYRHPNYPPLPEKYTRADVLPSGYVIVPAESGSIICYINQLDPKAAMVMANDTTDGMTKALVATFSKLSANLTPKADTS